MSSDQSTRIWIFIDLLYIPIKKCRWFQTRGRLSGITEEIPSYHQAMVAFSLEAAIFWCVWYPSTSGSRLGSGVGSSMYGYPELVTTIVVKVLMLAVVTVALIVGRTKVIVWGEKDSIKPRAHNDHADMPDRRLPIITAEIESIILISDWSRGVL